MRRRELRTLPHSLGASALLVGLGGCLGTTARFLIEEHTGLAGGWFPAATLCINLAGAFFLGFFLERLLLGGEDAGARRAARLFFGTGVCGSFTTYGTMISEGVEMATSGSPAAGAAYLALSVGAGIALAAFGMRCARAVGIRKGAVE